MNRGNGTKNLLVSSFSLNGHKTNSQNSSKRFEAGTFHLEEHDKKAFEHDL